MNSSIYKPENEEETNLKKDLNKFVFYFFIGKQT
jgi:hypothetical protein